MAIDTIPNPGPDRCFFKYMRSLHAKLDTSGINPSSTLGHPYFRTSDKEEYGTLLTSRVANKGRMGLMKVDTPENYDFLYFLTLRSKVYLKSYFKVHPDSEGERKDVFKHKGIKSIKHLTYEMFYDILTTNRQYTVLEKQFRSENFQIYASEIDKHVSSSFCEKRFFFHHIFLYPMAIPTTIFIYNVSKMVKMSTIFKFHDLRITFRPIFGINIYKISREKIVFSPMGYFLMISIVPANTIKTYFHCWKMIYSEKKFVSTISTMGNILAKIMASKAIICHCIQKNGFKENLFLKK